jgi:Proteins of 100 residues with WXG.
MAQSPQTQVSEHDLQEAINWIGESAERIRNIQRNLDAAGADLSVHWQGESHYAFNKVHILWHEHMDVILGSLQSLAESIRTNNQNYSAFNAQALSDISKIEALINAAPPAALTNP